MEAGTVLAWPPINTKIRNLREEITKLARQHNDANIISIPARFLSLEKSKELIKVFSKTNFDGGRHERRVKKI